MLGEPDRNQLALAEANDWILTTFDDDFLSIIEAEGLGHAGVIYIHQPGKDIGDVVKAVDAHLDERSPDDRGVHYV
jgi:hypothetical protein